MCLAIKFLHENGIIYRAVKLENILLATDGHIRITDFGTSKQGMAPGNTTSSFIGTSVFVAPEVSSEKKAKVWQ